MKNIHDWIVPIANDHLSGATHLTDRAIDVFERWLVDSQKMDLKQSRPSLKEIGILLVQAQSAMASIFNLANRVLWTAEDATSLENLRESVSLAIEDYARLTRRHQTALLKHSLSLIEGKRRIITLSFSATVLNALKSAHDKGHRFEVICAESRPFCEGVEFAKTLSAYGVTCELLVDALAPSYVEESDLVLVGGDGVTSASLINKIGTYALALAAKWHHVPFVTLVTTQKIFPDDCSVKLPLGKPTDILNPIPVNIRIANPYFEKIPLSLIPTLLTEQGPLDRRSIARIAKALRTHPSLKQAL